jgi:hypothetical protein
MALFDTICKNAKSEETPYKLVDEKGIFLLINPNVSKYFRQKHCWRKRKSISTWGIFPYRLALCP